MAKRACAPCRAVFQTQNRDPDGELLTLDEEGRYVGNPVSNIQLLVAKAISLVSLHDQAAAVCAVASFPMTSNTCAFYCKTLLQLA